MTKQEFLELEQTLISAADELGIPVQMGRAYSHTYGVLDGGYLTTPCPIQNVKIGSASAIFSSLVENDKLLIN